MLGAQSIKTKFRNLYFSGRGTQVNKQLQNCYRNMQEFKDDTQEGSRSGTSQDKLLGRSGGGNSGGDSDDGFMNIPDGVADELPFD